MANYPDDWEKTNAQKALENAAAAQQTATAAQTFIGTCSTDAATADKTVTGVTGFALASGACIAITFSAANTAASPTLNINATGAKPIMLNGAPYAYWVAGATVQFIDDGTSWQVCNVPLYGATATIGNPASKNIYIDADSFNFRQATNTVASLGIEPYAETHNLLSLLCGANYDGVKVGGGAYAIFDQRVADATYGRYGSCVIAGMHEAGAPRVALHAYRGDGSVAHPVDKEAEIDVGIDDGGNSYIGVSADTFFGQPIANLTAILDRGSATLSDGVVLSWSGGIACLSVCKQVTLPDSWSSVSIGTIPSGKRPLADITAPALADNHTLANVAVSITAGGNVTANVRGSDPPGTQWIQASVPWKY